MNLLLFHPQLLDRTCRNCQSWMFDEQHRVVTRLELPVRRPPGSPTPCWQCPKKSPAQSAGYERDMPRIQGVLRLYLQVRATAGRCLTPEQAGDRIVARNLAIVDTIVRRWEWLRAQEPGVALPKPR